MDYAIETRDLVKTYGHVRALDGLNLQVRSGEVHGFLGPNGAGKSTTIRVLLGLLRPDGGEVHLLGGDPWLDAVALHRRLSYVPGDVELWPNLTGGEAIDLLARLRGRFDRSRRDALCERFALDPSRKAGTYSKGNRQKVALVAALASDVELLVLDEPTSGLDPLMEEEFQQVMLQEKARGRTILLSSHILSQVERLADRVSIIRSGRIVDAGTLQDLRHLTRTSVVAQVERPIRNLDGLHGIHDPRIDGETVTFDVDLPELDAAIGFLHQSRLVSLVCHPPSLEQLFLRHYRADEPGDVLAGGDA